MSVVSFTDYAPPPRYDGVHYVSIRIEESSLKDGPWSLIETKTISPDPDPTQPSAHSFTTVLAVLDQGWYRVTFVDENGGTATADSIQNIPSDEHPFTPSVKEVALKILSRTTDSFGNLVRTFNANTTPSDADVRDLIRQASLQVADVVGDDIPDDVRDDAANVTAILAAMLVEVTYFSDQVNTGRSIYPQLEKQYLREIQNLSKAAIAAKEGDGSIKGTTVSNVPSYSFPAPMTTRDGIWN